MEGPGTMLPWAEHSRGWTQHHKFIYQDLSETSKSKSHVREGAPRAVISSEIQPCTFLMDIRPVLQRREK